MKSLFILFPVLYLTHLFAQSEIYQKKPFYYTITAEESLEDVARKFKTEKDSLRAWNGEIDSIYPGARLIIGYFQMTQPEETPRDQILSIDLPDSAADSVEQKVTFSENPVENKPVSNPETIVEIEQQDQKEKTERKAEDHQVEKLPEFNALVFCGGVEDDMPVGVTDKFYSNIGSGFIYAFFKQDTALVDRHLIVEVYKENNPGNFDQLITTISYDVKPKWTYTYFKNNFKEPGNYLIKLYKEDKTLKAQGEISVLEK